MEKLSFSLKLEEVQIEIMDIEGSERIFVLKELTSEQRSKFLNQTGKKVKFGQGGSISTVTDHHFLQENLLTLCLYDDQGKAVTREVLAKYPAHVISKLFEAAQELSGMNDNGEDEAKND